MNPQIIYTLIGAFAGFIVGYVAEDEKNNQPENTNQNDTPKEKKKENTEKKKDV
jgi:hypothetical protein